MRLSKALRSREFWLRAGAIVAVFALSVFILIKAERLRELSTYGYAGVFVLSFLTNATIFLPAPSWVIPIAAGTTLNPLFVGLLAGTGQTLGELTGFIAGASGRIIIEDRDRYDWLSGLAKKYGLWLFIVLSFVPNPIFDLAGIIAGALRIPVLHFLLATWIGKTARTLLLAYGGYGVFNHWFST